MVRCWEGTAAPGGDGATEQSVGGGEILGVHWEEL